MIRTLALVLALTGAAACARTEPPAAQAASSGAGAAAAKAWLAENAKKPGITVLPSGLQYQVIRSGAAAGPRPDKDDLVKVHYEGTLTDGTEFDSSFREGRPLVAKPENLVPGWTEVLQLMRPGDEWRVFLPPELGYGAEGTGPIPPDSVLVFRMELLDVLPR